MTNEELGNKSIDFALSTTNLLLKNNALLETVIDLLVDVESRLDNTNKDELSSKVSELVKKNYDEALSLLVEIKDAKP